MENVKDGKPVEEVEENFIDIDVSTPRNYDVAQGNQTLCSSESSTEFEFNMSSVPGELCESADQLFFKGQLLPLLLPSRLHMLQALCASEQCDSQRFHAQEGKFSSGFFNPVISNSRSDNFTFDTHATPELVQLHCNFTSESQNCSSFWDSCDKDSEESSCRDSNGSSQDSCFSSKDMEMRERISRGLEDSFNSSQVQAERRHSFWLKIAFQWKLIFGSKKASKSKIHEKGMEKPPPDSRDVKPSISLQNSSHVALAVAPLTAECSSLGRPPHETGHHTTALFGYPRTTHRDTSTRNEAQKLEDPWHKHLNQLKRLREKISDRREQGWTEEESMAAKTLSNLFVGDSPADENPSCASFLHTSLRVPSFTRRSSAPASRISSSRSSPNHSGVLSPLDYATVEDIQNAVQGAIAHCKQSQIGTTT